ncbi:hypothetical protein M413DRAFT_63528, partial [Hebeloma cylindrosporum]
HSVVKDDWYRGYFIPKGTMCLANIWYLLFIFDGPDVDAFNPDRFIGEHGRLLPALADTKDGMLFSRLRIPVQF